MVFFKKDRDGLLNSLLKQHEYFIHSYEYAILDIDLKQELYDS